MNKISLVRLFTFLVTIILFSVDASAGMRKMVLQGFLKSGTTALNGSFKMKFLVKRNGSPAYSYCPTNSVTVTNGAFNFQLDDANPSNCADGAATNTLFSQVAQVNFGSDQFTVDVVVDVNNDNFASQAIFSGISLVAAPFALACQQAETALSATTATSANSATTATNVSGIVDIINGGTGATSPSAARTNLGAASAGANSDITSLSGLTSPLSSSQGGTGVSSSATFPTAGTIATVPAIGFVMSNGSGLTSVSSLDLSSSVGASILSATNGGTGISSSATFPTSGTIATVPAAGFIKSDGNALYNTSSIDLATDTNTTALPVAKGGTGGTSSTEALTNLGAAAANINNDIVSLNAITSISAPIASSLTLASGLNTISVSSSKITNLAEPSAAQDAATKNYVDASVPTVIRTYIAQPASATITNLGFSAAATATGTAATLDSNTSVQVRYTSGTTSNNCAGLVGARVGRIGHGLDVQTKFITDAAANTSARTVFGLSQTGTTAPATSCTAGPAGSDSPNTYSAAYFRYSPSAADTQWMCLTCNATNCTTSASGVTVANDTQYQMRIKTDATTVSFYINGQLVCSTTSTIPAAGTDLVPIVATNATSTTAKTIRISYIRALSY